MRQLVTAMILGLVGCASAPVKHEPLAVNGISIRYLMALSPEPDPCDNSHVMVLDMQDHGYSCEPIVKMFPQCGQISAGQ